MKYRLLYIVFLGLWCWLLPLGVSAAVVPAGVQEVFNSATAPAQAKQEEMTAQQLEQTLQPLIKLLQDKKQQQQLLQQLKQLQQSAKAANAQKQSAAIKSPMNSWLYRLTQQVKLAQIFWLQHLDAAYSEIQERVVAVLLPVAVTIAVAAVSMLLLRLWLKRLVLRVLRNNSFNRASRLSNLFSAHYMKRVAKYMLQYPLPLVLALLVSSTAVTNFFVYGATIDFNLLNYLLLNLINAVLFALLLVVLAPLLAYSKRNKLLQKFQQNLIANIFALVWCLAWANVLAHPQLIQAYGYNFMFVLRAVLNIGIVLAAGWLILVIKPAMTFWLNYQPAEQRKNKVEKSYWLKILSVGWFIPLMFLVILSLLSLLLGDSDSTVLNTSIITSAVMFFAITFYVILGHLIRVKEHYQVLTLAQERSNRLHKFFLFILRGVLLAVAFELIMSLWGYSFEQLQSTLGINLSRPLIIIFSGVIIAWLLIILLDCTIRQYLSGASARVQTILPLINLVLKTVVVLTTLLVLMMVLGLNITPLLAGAGILGLAIGFGAQSLVADIITGIFILIEDSISVGDYIATVGHEGKVEQLTLRTISLRDLEGVLHVLPFSQIKGVKNFSREVGYTMMRVPVPYTVSVDKVISLVQQAVQSLRASADLGEVIWSDAEMQGIESFKSGLAHLRFRIETAPLHQWQVMRFLYLDLKRRFEQENIPWAVPYLDMATDDTSAKQQAPGQTAAVVEDRL